MKTAIKAVSSATRSLSNRRWAPPLNAHFPPQLIQRKSWRNADPLVSVYYNVMGQEVGYANIDQSTLDKVIEVSVKKEELLSFARQNCADSFCHPAQEYNQMAREHLASAIWHLVVQLQVSAAQRGEAYHAHCCWSSTGAQSVHCRSGGCKRNRWAETPTLNLGLTLKKKCYYVQE